MFKNKIKKWFW